MDPFFLEKDPVRSNLSLCKFVPDMLHGNLFCLAERLS